MSKRKRVVLNFQQKLEILQQLNEGKSGAVLAKQYGIGTSTISDIKRNADAILQFVSNLECEDQISEKKTRKTAQNTDLDSRIYRWYLDEKKKGISPPDAAICAKALEINKLLTSGSENFKASLGWLRHFKHRRGIKDGKEQTHHESTDTKISKQFKNIIKRGGYTLDNIYNIDDSFLLWKSLPNWRNKSLVTIITCTNANVTHKLPLCVIGCEQIHKTHEDLPVLYKTDHSNLTFFENWFEEVFIPEVKKRQQTTRNVGKVLVVMDDSSWHPSRDVLIKERTDIDIFFIPNSMNPIIQPMEIEMKRFKTLYRKKLLELLYNRAPCPIKQFVEEFTLNESIYVIGEAWDSISRTDIAQSWGKLLSDVENGTESTHDGILEIVAIAQKIIGLDQCNFEDVLQWLECDKEDYCFINTDDLNIEENHENGITEPSDLEAYHSLGTVIDWFMRQKECNSSQMSTLESLRDLATSKMRDNIKQEPE